MFQLENVSMVDDYEETLIQEVLVYTLDLLLKQICMVLSLMSQ